MSTMVVDLADQINILNTKFDELKSELPLRNQQVPPPWGLHGQTHPMYKESRLP